MKDEKEVVEKPQPKSHKRRLVVRGFFGLIGLVVLLGSVYGYTYAQTPAHIRRPSFQHYHFRAQVLVDGTVVDFSQAAYQVAIPSASCNAGISDSPIHFHDNQDQLVHIHWDGMTGGEFLKYYGWNFIGGGDDLLGRRFDLGTVPQSVKIHGRLLPATPAETSYFVYVGDQQNFERKNWDDFLAQDLEVFFGKESRIGQQAVSSNKGIFDWLFPKVSAHDEVLAEQTSTKSEEELSRINNLIGNVVIFAQKDEPSQEQVHERFDNLVELKESTCGG